MASAAADEKTEGGAHAAPSGGGAPAGGSKLVLILTGVNVLVSVGMVAILLISFQRDAKKPKVEDISAHEAPAADAHGKPGEHGALAKDAHGNPTKAGAGKKGSEFGKMVTLDQFTVNLSTPGSSSAKFVRVNVSLEVPNDDSENEVTAKMPQIRNVIIDLFNSKRAADLATADGRDYLKEEIKNAMNGFLIHGKVRGVFFTNFALSS